MTFGQTVIEVESDRIASLGGVVLAELSLEDAERLVNALNALELRCANLARRRVLDDLGLAWLYEPAGSLPERQRHQERPERNRL
jgi:hypothetical protein